jgi:hypothetical protein
MAVQDMALQSPKVHLGHKLDVALNPEKPWSLPYLRSCPVSDPSPASAWSFPRAALEIFNDLVPVFNYYCHHTWKGLDSFCLLVCSRLCMIVSSIHLEVSSMIIVSVVIQVIIHKESKATKLLIYSLKIDCPSLGKANFVGSRSVMVT